MSAESLARRSRRAAKAARWPSCRARCSRGRPAPKPSPNVCLARIAERDSSINAFITVLADEARAQARAADQEIAAGRYRGPLHGVPISLKDLIDLRGTPTTAASRVRRGHVAARDSVVAARLRAAGAVFVGKTNLHEFALGTTNEDSAYGPVHHPLDHTRSPGGSSGGSAASVLADMCYASIGSDTGGSIRIPSAACGLVGLKPALGEIPTDGVVPLSSTLDHVGPLCRSVEDAAILHQTLGGVSNPTPIKARELRGLAARHPAAVLLRAARPGRRGAIRRVVRTADARGRRARRCRDRACRGDRDDLRARRAGGGRGLSRANAGEPAGRLHAERPAAPGNGPLHPGRGLRPRDARPRRADARRSTPR